MSEWIHEIYVVCHGTRRRREINNARHLLGSLNPPKWLDITTDHVQYMKAPILLCLNLRLFNIKINFYFFSRQQIILKSIFSSLEAEYNVYQSVKCRFLKKNFNLKNSVETFKERKKTLNKKYSDIGNSSTKMRLPKYLQIS